MEEVIAAFCAGVLVGCLLGACWQSWAMWRRLQSSVWVLRRLEEMQSRHRPAELRKRAVDYATTSALIK